ncbi:MAG: sulfatase-like hydrolase/transferase [Rikenellaceae bacterium]
MKEYFTATLAVAIGCCGYAQRANNILVVVADDLGCEVLSLYDTPTTERANTPNLDKLAARGVTFDNVWGAPLSAPVRAAMLTGRHGHHTGIVALDITLPKSEVTLFEALPEEYTNAVIGKWHLSDYENFAPDYGIDHFAGIATEGGVRNYSQWRFTENGVSIFTTEYATTKITDSAKKWIEAQKSPWLCWVAYNAPHIPMHLPPSHMHTHKELTGTPEDMESNRLAYYLAMVESFDYDLGRLLESVDDSTTIIFIGDNGTEKRSLQAPYSPRHGKGSLYDSGVAIPMIVCGAGVPKGGERSSALVSAVDIFPTVMEFAGKEMPKYQDAYSFASVVTGGETLRKFNYSEILNPRMGYMNAISDGVYKLITTKSGTEEFYNTDDDVLEQSNLIGKSLSEEQEAALTKLRAELTAMKIPLDSIPESNPNAKGDPSKRYGNGNGNRGGGGGYGGNRNGGSYNSYNSSNSYNNNSYNGTRSGGNSGNRSR